jgi:hypothetical protein
MPPQVDKLTLARSSPAGFAWYASDGQWILAPHLKLLSQKIVGVATGQIPRLIVTMPPRHGKSELISKYTPAWFLGAFPDKKVMLASYADTFAAQWGRKSRDLLEEFGPKVFGVSINQESKSGAHWEVGRRKDGKKAEGVMVTAGVGGGLTGKGAHLLIIDDPVKNSEEAQSETTRQAHHDWWKSTARTRLQKGAGVILVMTRWHEDDLAGRLIADELEGGDQWEVLNLPAICEVENDLIGRSAGEPLWPEMFDLESLEQTKRAMGNYWFSSMYQQRPAPADGMLFKRQNFRYYEKLEGNLVSHPHRCWPAHLRHRVRNEVLHDGCRGEREEAERLLRHCDLDRHGAEGASAVEHRPGAVRRAGPAAVREARLLRAAPERHQH